MTRTSHHSHPTPGFPITCLAWTDDSHLVLGGGGGSSRTGVKNKLKFCIVTEDGKEMATAEEWEFQPGEDSPTSLDVDRERKQVVAGVNASESSIKSDNKNGNSHCRTFSYTGNKIKPLKSCQTIADDWSDDYPYQKLTSLNRTATLLAVGTTNNRVSILRFPDLEKIDEDVVVDEVDGELVALDWSADGAWLSITSENAIQLLSFAPPSSSAALKAEAGASSEKTTVTTTWKMRQKIYPPSLDIAPVTFKSAKFSRLSPSPSNQPLIHAILNTNPAKAAGGAASGARARGSQGARRSAQPAKKAFLCNFALVQPQPADPAGEKKKSIVDKSKDKENEELGKWDVVARRELGAKPVTVLDVSDDGNLVAYALADYSVGILDSQNLTPLLKILKAHSFAITGLAFNPSANLLASAGADNAIRIIVVPSSFGGSAITILACILALIIAFVAYYLQVRSS